jgi:hypothetical protein
MANALPTLPAAVRRRLMPASYLIEPFDLFLHGEEQALLVLQNRFAAFLRALDGPARFATWHVPATLRPLIDWSMQEAALTANP